MGWLHTYAATKSDIIKERCAREEYEKAICSTEKHCCKGNVLWRVAVHFNKETQVTTRYIACDLLSNSKDYGWGYKDMDESVHPFYYSCPLSYLKDVPVACEEWREKVKLYHAKRTQKLEVGKTYTLVNGCSVPEITILQLRPLIGTYLGVGRYRVKRSLIECEKKELAQQENNSSNP